MTLLLVVLLVPLVAAIILAGGRPGPIVGCLCLMGVGCLIACSGLTRLVRQRA